MFLFTGMDSDSDVQRFRWQVVDDEGPNNAEYLQRHVRDLPGMLFSVLFRKPTRHHVGITDCLHFVYAELFDAIIEQAKKWAII